VIGFEVQRNFIGPPVVRTAPCIHCGRRAQLILDHPQDEPVLQLLRQGQSVQYAFWHRPADERELLMTGIHAHCYEAIAPEEEEEDD
jgi:hypothetical protein